MRLLSLALAALAAASMACSSDGTGTSSSVDAGAAADSAVPAAILTQGCTTYDDRTVGTASRVIVWGYDVAQDPGHCMKIKAGQAVTFVDTDGTSVPDFVTHPMLAQGGDTPSPITGFDRTTGRAPFPDAGTFGFQCAHHPTMLGAIYVVP